MVLEGAGVEVLRMTCSALNRQGAGFSRGGYSDLDVSTLANLVPIHSYFSRVTGDNVCPPSRGCKPLEHLMRVCLTATAMRP
jgi:hypothetical protein